MNAYDIEFTGLDGKPLLLSSFKGRAMLIVNVASACGFTPQYAPMQALAEEFGTTGPVIIGLPCNDFGAQEPGSSAVISDFCDTKFGVTFPMSAKVDIVDPTTRHLFYQFVANQLGENELPKWNFHKYVIGPDGDLIGSFGPRISPDAPDVRAALGV